MSFNEAGAGGAPETISRCGSGWKKTRCFNEAGAGDAPEISIRRATGPSATASFNETGAGDAPEIDFFDGRSAGRVVASMRLGQVEPRKPPLGISLRGLEYFATLRSAVVWPAEDALTLCAESSIIFANSLSKNRKRECERCPRKRRYESARTARGSFARLHNSRLPGTVDPLVNHPGRNQRRVAISRRRGQTQGQLAFGAHTGKATVKLRYLSLVIRWAAVDRDHTSCSKSGVVWFRFLKCSHTEERPHDIHTERYFPDRPRKHNAFATTLRKACCLEPSRSGSSRQKGQGFHSKTVSPAHRSVQGRWTELSNVERADGHPQGPSADSACRLCTATAETAKYVSGLVL